MKKVLIADDDFLVRTYLKQMIPWEKHGLFIVGDAKNGAEALELLQRDGADILIADVSMPIMNGIELTRRVKKILPSTRILILSCHDDFEYVKEAMKLGIDDYLLKNNLTEETLLDALKKILDAMSEQPENDSAIERLALIGRKKLREDFFSAFDTNGDKLDELAREAEIPANFQAAAALMIVPQNWLQREQKFTETERENFFAAFAEMSLNTCKNLAGEKVQPLIFTSQREGFFHWCLIVDTDKPRDIAERLQNFAKLYFNLELKIFLSPTKKNLDGLSDEWQKLYVARADLFYSDEKIFSAETLPTTTDKISAELETSARELIDALSFIDEDFNDALKNFREKIFAAKLRPDVLTKFVAELFTEAERDLLPSPSQAENFSDWFARLENFLRELRGRQGRDRLHPAIRLALRFIDEHYREDISQTTVADDVHLNASYFSSLFKKSLGQGFAEYLTELRIERVKERLATSSEKIKVIATSEGFRDAQYFVKIFKKTTGLTPSEYRQKFFRPL